MKTRFSFSAFGILLALACLPIAAQGQQPAPAVQPAAPAQTQAQPPTVLPEASAPYWKLYAILYQTHSAEYRALCHQAYNLATLRLEQAVKARKKGQKPLAVVTDLDETALDNSPYYAQRLLEMAEYTPPTWEAFTATARAKAVPGAVDFFRRANALGVRIVYMSNRKQSELAGTLANMQNLGFPQADTAHLMLRRAEGSSKELRRRRVLATHDIALLIGDNLNDFAQVFEGTPMTQRAADTDSLSKAFGRRFIVLPNAIYGEWESALTDYHRLPDADRRKTLDLLLQQARDGK